VDEAVAGGLGLQRADRLAPDEEQVVGEAVAGCHPELAHGHAGSGGEVQLRTVLDDPARRSERGIDLYAGFLLRRRAHEGAPRCAWSACATALMTASRTAAGGTLRRSVRKATIVLSAPPAE